MDYAQKQNGKKSNDIMLNSCDGANSVLVNHEIQRLTNEINMLREANKMAEEKKVVSCSTAIICEEKNLK